MSSSPAAALADFLEGRARSVRAIEAQAEEIIHQEKNQAGYEAKMREKAELLAAIAAEASTLVHALPAGLRDAAAERLEQFAANAGNALRIGSVFYMSALLYPDDHTPGEPNNLELLAAEVRGWA